MYRLLATDLDGTLLDSASKVPQVNIEAIARAKSKGIATIACTARSARSVKGISEVGGMGPYAICANGSIGYNIETEEVLWHERITPSDSLAVVAALREISPSFLFAAEQHLEFYPEVSFLRGESVITRFDEIERIESHISDGATKIICRHPTLTQLEIVNLIDQVTKGTLATSPGSISWVEILPPGVSKGYGLIKLMEIAGYSASESAAIGDHLNDLPMLEIAGYSASVGNAHPLTKKAADIAVSSNEQGGVAEFLDILIALNEKE